MPIDALCPSIHTPIISPPEPNTSAPAHALAHAAPIAPWPDLVPTAHAAAPELVVPRAPSRPWSQTATTWAPQQPPAWFKIGFDEDHSIDDITVKSMLAQGRPFAADVDAKLREILGAPFHAGGLETLFSQAWPSAACVAPVFALTALEACKDRRDCGWFV